MSAGSYHHRLDSPPQRQLVTQRSSGAHRPRDPEPGKPYPRSDSHRRTVLLAAAAVALCELAGMVAVIRGYQIGEGTLTSQAEFAWFWAGMCLMVMPLAVLIACARTPPPLRTALLILYGFVSYAPKLLRDPHAPLYHDEFAHWRATYNILSTGKLFQPTPLVPIISRYPGLHTATAALVHATGLTIWQAATVLLVVFHVALVLGIAALAEAAGLGRARGEPPSQASLGTRTACLTAIFYGLNSSFLYFDTQYAYESMAITLVVWTLVAYVQAIRSRRGPVRASWASLTVLMSAATVVTHHLSAFTLVLIMALVSLAVSLPWLARAHGWRIAALTAWGLTLVAAGMAGAWFAFVAPATFSYLSPYLGQGLSELMQAASGSGASRQLFGASLSPWWEQKSAYLMTAFAFALTVGGLLLLRSRIRDQSLPKGHRRALTVAFAALGLIYFPSTLFILSPAGAEGARRSWAFTWIGLCLLMSPGAVWLLDWAKRSTRRWSRIVLRSGFAGALAVVMVGGTAAGIDASYRFPGPFLYGSDARSITPELLGTSSWFSARFGTGNNVITDRYTGLVFASFGLQNPAAPSVGFPAYNLFLAKSGAPIEPSWLLSELQNSHYTYLVVDRRMAYELPQLGIYFEPDEPHSLLAPAGHKPVFYGRLAKFNNFSWMTKVFQSENYSIYRLNLPVTKPGYQLRPPALRGRLLVTS
jgi:hypothetical protein